jgi:hypothetical protein
LGSVHGQQVGDAAQARRLGTVQRHQQRELAVGQAHRPQGLVEATGQGPRGALDVQAKARVADVQRRFKGNVILEIRGRL